MVYEFFDKEITVKTHEFEEDTTQMSNSGCSEPFITEEILIIAQSLAKERIQYYKEEKSDEKHLSLFLPEFEALENKEENQFMERSVFNFGSPHYYNYTE